METLRLELKCADDGKMFLEVATSGIKRLIIELDPESESYKAMCAEWSPEVFPPKNDRYVIDPVAGRLVSAEMRNGSA